MKVLQIVFIILAIINAIGGLMYLTQATTGVGIICLGCFLGIIARICQAESHNKK